MADLKRPKFIQITAALSVDTDMDEHKCLYALDENGDVWFYAFGGSSQCASWRRMDMEREP
jgi:hypothetical protein